LKEKLDVTTFEGGAYKDPIPGKDDDVYENVEEEQSSSEPTVASLFKPPPRRLPKEKKQVSLGWTKEELAALQKGVIEHGYNWKTIKRYYAEELSRHLEGMALRDKVLQIRRYAKANDLDITTYEGGAYRYPIPGKG
jgi:hypothetical protein